MYSTYNLFKLENINVIFIHIDKNERNENDEKKRYIQSYVCNDEKKR